MAMSSDLKKAEPLFKEAISKNLKLIELLRPDKAKVVQQMEERLNLALIYNAYGSVY
jgi:hypothetical protein